MKVFVCFFLLCAAALAQTPDSTTKIVTFNRADSEHCKAVVSNGKPLLQTTYNGTTVAITMPQNWGNGEFSVFVAVTQAGTGEVQINPKEISALYSDPDHTRFRWFDKAHDLETISSMRSAGLGQPGGAPAGPPGSGSLGDSSSTMPPPNHPEARPEMDPHVGTRSEEESRQLQLRSDPRNPSSFPKLDPAHPPAFLRHTTVKQGSTAAGYVFFRKPKGSKVEVTSNGMLDEVDIPMNGVIFRF